MKIYFSGSVRGGREKQKEYFEIIKHLQKYGEVLTEHLGNPELSILGERNISDIDIYKRDVSFVKEADILVAEVSVPSLGVGYEIARAEGLGKRVLCLHDAGNKNVSVMIRGNKNILLEGYNNLEELFEHIDKFIKNN